MPKSAEELSKYWVPLIACFTGMRQSEIAQLDGDDVVDRDGIWCIDINDRGDKRLKNGNARRIVSLHPMLLRSGLVEFAKKRSGQKMLADVIPYNGKLCPVAMKYDPSRFWQQLRPLIMEILPFHV